MKRYSASIVIATSPERVFAYLTDFARHPEWAGDILSVAALDDGPVGRGWRFRSIGHQAGAQKDESVVTQFEPPDRLTFETNGDEGCFSNSFVLEAVASVTRLTKTFEFRETRGLARLAQVVYPLIAVRGMTSDLKRIKARLEAVSSADN